MSVLPFGEVFGHSVDDFSPGAIQARQAKHCPWTHQEVVYFVGIGGVSMKGQGTSHPGKRYDSEFKRESVRLADTSGKTDRQIERDLGLYQGAIRRWRDELEADPMRVDCLPGTSRTPSLMSRGVACLAAARSAKSPKSFGNNTRPSRNAISATFLSCACSWTACTSRFDAAGCIGCATLQPRCPMRAGMRSSRIW